MTREPMPDDVRDWLQMHGADSLDDILGSLDAAMLPRPVMERRLRRSKGSEVGPPTEAEKADAIRVLELGDRAPHWLYLEAERIFCEASP